MVPLNSKNIVARSSQVEIPYFLGFGVIFKIVCILRDQNW